MHCMHATGRSPLLFCLVTLPLISDSCKPRASQGTRSSTESTSSTSVAVAATDTGSAVRYEYRDRAGLFDPDGYYTPQDSLVINQWELSYFELHSIDHYYDGELHYDRPRVLLPPQVRFVISSVTTDAGSAPSCPALVSPDTLAIRCLVAELGDVQIDGHFVDSSGWFTGGNRPAVEAVVLIARVVVRRQGTVIYDHVDCFTFTTGD